MWGNFFSTPGGRVAANRTTTEEPSLTIIRPPRSAFRRKRFLVPFVPSVLVALIGVISLVVSGNVVLKLDRIVVLEGKIASKAEFFTDDAVRRILMSHGIQVHLTQVGSREIATSDLDGYDFVFPSGKPTGLLIRNRLQEEGKSFIAYRPFFSPVVLASFRDYAEALVRQGTAKPQPGPLYYDLSMDGFVGLMREGTTWRKLGQDNGNLVLAQTPDVCWSNTAGTYLGLVASVTNGNRAPVTEAEALDLATKIKPWLLSQGMSNEDIPRMYFAPEGRGFAPVVVIYEHQFLAHQLRVKAQTGAVDAKRVLLYPEAQLQSVPEFIGLTESGVRLGELLTADPALRKRALELGLRVLQRDGTLYERQVSEFLGEHGIDPPAIGVGDTEAVLPALPLLEKMIVEVGGCKR